MHVTRPNPFSHPALRREVVLPLIVAFAVATLMSGVTTAEGAWFRALHNEPVQWLPLAAGRLVDWYTCAAMVPLLYVAAARFPVAGPQWWRSLPVQFVAFAAAAVAKFALYVPLRRLVDPAFHGSIGNALSHGFVDKLWFFAGISVVLHVFLLHRKPFQDRFGAVQPSREDRAFPPDVLPVADGGGMRLIRTADIAWIEAQGNYVLIHTQGGAHLMRETMTHLCERLDRETFLRIHRSTIVNRTNVARIEPLAGGRLSVTLRDGPQLTVGRAHSVNVREHFGVRCSSPRR